MWGELQNFVVFLLPLLAPRAVAASPILSWAAAAMHRVRIRGALGPLLAVFGSSSRSRWKVASLFDRSPHADILTTVLLPSERPESSCWHAACARPVASKKRATRAEFHDGAQASAPSRKQNRPCGYATAGSYVLRRERTCAGQRLTTTRGERASGGQQACCYCGESKVLCPVVTPCCSAVCCYMCAQRAWHASVRPLCPACASPLRQVLQHASLMPD